MRFSSERRGRCGLLWALFLVSGASALGDKGVPEPMMGRERWGDGWLLTSGVGVTHSYLFTENEAEEQQGIGPHLSTSVGYCDHDAYCLEAGSLVGFLYYDGYQSAASSYSGLFSGDTSLFTGQKYDVWMWETALYAAIRARVPGTRPRGQFDPWIKLMSGYGANVGYLASWSKGYDSLEGMRIQDEGPLFGVSLSNLFNNEGRGRVWFLEWSMLIQLHWNSWLIKPNGILPTVAGTSKTDGNPYSTLISLSVGYRVF